MIRETPRIKKSAALHCCFSLQKTVFRVGDVFIEKKIAMVYGENTAAVVYRIINGTNRVKLTLAPLVNFRDYHHTSKKYHMNFKQKPYDNGVIINPYDLDFKINIFCNNGTYTGKENCWFENMSYAVELERGLDPLEGHYIPGYFEVEAGPGEDKYVTIIATTEDSVGNADGLSIISAQEARMSRLLEMSGLKDDLALKLSAAADNFIVYRKSTGAKTIIAGYPWFTDWGRDTMIALPGLTLVTGRYDDAKQILYTFSRYVKDGLIPNMFPDAGQEPSYNTVDAPLWYFEAVNKYIGYTGDRHFIREHIYETLKSIIDAYIKGTGFNIKMDKDFLVSAGDERTQLTWMDAKVGDRVVTLRHGKAVEINALWYNRSLTDI